jgi:hypothetical protein
MESKKKVWSAKYDGKQIHIENNKRVPRKLKKVLRVIFESLGDNYNGYVIVSPTYYQILQKYEEIANSIKDNIDG